MVANPQEDFNAHKLFVEAPDALTSPVCIQAPVLHTISAILPSNRIRNSICAFWLTSVCPYKLGDWPFGAQYMLSCIKLCVAMECASSHMLWLVVIPLKTAQEIRFDSDFF